MKSTNVLITLFVTLITIAGPSIFAQGSLSLDHVDGLLASDVVAVEQEITFYLRVTNNTAIDISGITNGFHIYSPDGAEWTTTTPDTTGTLGRTQFDGFFFISTFGIDGQGADTVGFGGTRLMLPGMPDGFDDIAYTITVGPIGAEHVGRHICLDSSFYPASGRWKWASPGVDIFPGWDGPHCYWIGEEGSCSIDLQTSIEGGMTFASNIVTVDWQTECPCNMILEYTVDGGATWEAIPGAEDLDPGTNTFDWEVPDSPTDNAMIRLCCTDESSCDQTEPFTINALGYLLVPDMVSTIQDAINLAQDDWTIEVAPGTYTENIIFRGKAINLVSTDGRSETFIEPANTNLPIVIFDDGEDNNSVIDGFTIQYTTNGSGIHCDNSSPTIQNCEIRFCISNSDGGGIWLGNTHAIVRNNLIHDNTAGATASGGGIGGLGTYAVEISYNEIYNNQAGHGSGIGFVEPTSGAIFHHNLIRGNTGGGAYAAGIYVNGNSCHIYNNTVLENTRGIKLPVSLGHTITNNIVVLNAGAGIDADGAMVDYNDVWNNDGFNAPGDNGISEDPLFLDPTQNNYGLSPGSPCIDAGNPDPFYLDPDGTDNDMGAYYFIQSWPLGIYPRLLDEDRMHVVGHTPTIVWSFYDPEGEQVGYNVEVGTDNDWSTAEMWATGEVTSADTMVQYAGAELLDGVTYSLRVRVSNNTQWGDWLSTTFRMNTAPTVPVPVSPLDDDLVHPFYVRLKVDNADDAEIDQVKYDFEIYLDEELTNLEVSESEVDEQSGQTQSMNFQGLIDDTRYFWRARACDMVECSPWTATLSFILDSESGISVPGDYATIQAAINGSDDGAQIVVAPGTYPERIDFMGKLLTVRSTHGRELTFITGDGSGGPTVAFVAGEDHGAVLNGFTIENPSGYGIFCNGAGPIIEECEIRNCVSSGDGAGIWLLFSSAIIRNNYIHGNVGATTGGGIGGESNLDLEIAHNIIADNVADHGSGIGFLAGTTNLNVHHNLILNNTGTGDYAGGIYINGTSCKIINNTISENKRGIKLIGGADFIILNNIIVSNLRDGLSSGSASYDYNNVWNNGSNNNPGDNGISQDPMFFDPLNDDYTLDTESPCIDAGSPDVQYNDEDGTRSDIGAYAYLANGLVVRQFRIIDENRLHVLNHIPTFEWMIPDVTIEPTAYEFQVGLDNEWTDAEMWATGEVASSETSVEYAGNELVDGESYFARVRASDGVDWSDWVSKAFRMNSVQAVPTPTFPVEGQSVHASFVYLSVANGVDLEGDALLYEFELFTDEELTSQLILLSGITGTPDSTKTDKLEDIPPDIPLWWRARTFDGFENSGWSETANFLTRGPGIIRVPSEVLSIQGGIDVAGEGDIVLVAPGTYVENIDFNGKSIKVWSTSGAEVTFIDRQNNGHIVQFHNSEGPEVELRGFSLRYSGSWSAMHISSSSPTIYQNIFYKNADGNTGGNTPLRVVGENASPSIHHNLFDDNGGVANIYVDSPVKFYNNTIVNSQRAGLIIYHALAIIRNNIIIGCPYYGLAGSPMYNGYNNYYGNDPNYLSTSPGEGDISEDPLFVDPENGDYHLSLQSPCIDAGDPDPIYIDLNGTRADMGAYSMNVDLPFPVGFQVVDEDALHIVNNVPTFAWSFFDTSATQVAYEVQVGLDSNWAEAEMWATGAVTSVDTTVVYSGEPLIDGVEYFARGRVSNADRWGSWHVLRIRMNTEPTIPTPIWPTDAFEVHAMAARLQVENATDAEFDLLTYEFEVYQDPNLTAIVVSETGVAQQEDATWSSIVEGLDSENSYWWRTRAYDSYEHSEWSTIEMFTTRGPGIINVPGDLGLIQSAIIAAGPLDTVLVAPGTYSENLDFLGKEIVVKSSHGADVTFLRPEVFNETTVIIDNSEGPQSYFGGFTVENGGMANTMWIGEICFPTIANNVFRNNIPEGSYSAPNVIYSWSNATITRNIFYLNGGSWVIRARSVELLINNTIVGNYAGIRSTYAFVLNNIVVNNQTDGIYGDFQLLDYNNVWGNENNSNPGMHGISADPLFVNPGSHDYSLQETSPCVGAGHPDPIYNDYDGTRNDIGAIPYPPPGANQVVPTTEWILVYCSEPMVDDAPLQPGDLVRAYDQDGVWCGVDTVSDDGSLGFMPIYADDPLTERDEGAEVGDIITFRINQRKALAVPDIVWTGHNAVTEVCSFTGEQCLDIDLTEGWNLISWNVEYEDSVLYMIADISDCVDVVIGFEQGALIFDPDLVQFSTLIDVDYFHGYWLRMSCDATLPVCGFFMSSPKGIFVNEGWNLVAYWPDVTLPVDAAFVSVSDNITAAIGYDAGSMIWLPDDPVHSNLTDLTPGAGYWMNSSRPDMLYWPGFGGGAAKEQPGPQAVAQKPTLASPTAMFIYGSDLMLDGEPMAAGATIEVLTSDSVLCGAGTYEDNVLRFTPIYGYDPNSEVTKPLPRQGDGLKLVVGGIEVRSDLTWQGNGSRVRLSELFSSSSFANDQLPTQYALGENYPNPFNASTVIRYDLPKPSMVTITIYDMLGRRVNRLVDGERPPGFHQTIWDGTNVHGKPVASGIYFYRIETADFTEAKKMVLLK